MPRRSNVASFALLAALLAATGCTAAVANNDQGVPGAPHLAGGVELPNPTPKPPITLTDTSGHPYDIATRTAGRLTLLFFGYTNCPDICSTTMSTIAAGLRQVSPAVRQHTTVLFVTVDPKRDTEAVLRHWLDRFDRGLPAFVGLRGTLSQVEGAQRLAGVPPSQIEKGKTPNAYTEGHSAEVLVFTKDNRSHVVYLANDTAKSYAHDLPLLLNAWT